MTRPVRLAFVAVAIGALAVALAIAVTTRADTIGPGLAPAIAISDEDGASSPEASTDIASAWVDVPPLDMPAVPSPAGSVTSVAAPGLAITVAAGAETTVSVTSNRISVKVG